MKLTSHPLVKDTFIQVFILFLANCLDYLRAQSLMTLTVPVGSTAVLPCDWKNTSISEWSDSSKIVWRSKSGMVFERSSNVLCRENKYDDRVNIPEDKLFSGNCSLVLRNVTFKDEGLYASSAVVQIGSRSKSITIQNVDLTVANVEVKDKNTSAKPDNENPPVCYSTTTVAILSTICSVSIIINIIVCVIYRRKVQRYSQAYASDQVNSL